ncbi:unnamed protein product [Ambrosiozyma monospora]|uniref:Unnamed protein product n=1 Tax=Ambrosiozyma monospora TaxID=43982 RepID=A0A9W6Z4P7_AMBMO|nr:unnamed protein product [Ambrosiozyma monospora]
MSEQFLQEPEAPRRRRKSSVGHINLGDTSVHALQTMQSQQEANSTKKFQRKQINTTASETNDLDILKKIWVSIKILSYRHTWLPPLIALLIPQIAYWFSNNYTESNPLHQFLELSYEIPGTEPKMYGKGKKDICFVLYMMIFFTFYREFLMQVILKPTAKHFGLHKENKLNRFMEQSYSMCYYGITGPWGLYIMKHTTLWYFNTTAFYEDYPHKTHEYMFKYYYLSQAAFWSQQSVVLILQLEKPRKDFHELVFHHIVTMALIACSYRFHYTWMGLAVYITMDISDWFLATAKTLNYLDSPLTNYVFISFVFVWTYLRHYINIKILWSVLTEFRTVGPWILNWETQQYKCWIAQPINHL